MLKADALATLKRIHADLNWAIGLVEAAPTEADVKRSVDFAVMSIVRSLKVFVPKKERKAK